MQYAKICNSVKLRGIFAYSTDIFLYDTGATGVV